jgi:hypothetical protein
MMEIETFVPLLLQQGEADDSSTGSSRLKRICLMGDHNQLPPVIKNMSLLSQQSGPEPVLSIDSIGCPV